MSVTPSMKFALELMRKHGCAEKIQTGRLAAEYKWTAGGQLTYGQVERALQKGLAVLVGAERNRAVLTDRGRSMCC